MVGLGAYPLLRVLLLAVSLLQRVTFSRRRVIGFGWIGGLSVAAGVAAGGFALTATHFSRRRKVSKRLCPRRTALRLGSVFPRYGVHPGASPPVCFAAPPLDGCGSAAWRCAPNPRMNTYARPAEGAKNQEPHQKPEPEPEPEPEPDQKIAAFGSSYMGLGAFSKRLVGCQAAIAGKPAPTEITADRIRFSPLNTMSVSSSTAFDLRARRQAEWRD